MRSLVAARACARRTQLPRHNRQGRPEGVARALRGQAARRARLSPAYRPRRAAMNRRRPPARIAGTGTGAHPWHINAADGPCCEQSQRRAFGRRRRARDDADARRAETRVPPPRPSPSEQCTLSSAHPSCAEPPCRNRAVAATLAAKRPRPRERYKRCSLGRVGAPARSQRVDGCVCGWLAAAAAAARRGRDLSIERRCSCRG